MSPTTQHTQEATKQMIVMIKLILYFKKYSSEKLTLGMTLSNMA